MPKDGAMPRNGSFNFNDTHPELKEGEMFVANISQNSEIIGGMYWATDPLIDNTLNNNFEKINWETKRLGNIGYSPSGKPNGLFPVFIQKTEFEMRMKK
jgi:hypothetical protein